MPNGPLKASFILDLKPIGQALPSNVYDVDPPLADWREKNHAFFFNRSSRKTVSSHHSHTLCDYKQATARPRRVVPVRSPKTTSEHAPGVAVKKFDIDYRLMEKLPSSMTHREFRFKCLKVATSENNSQLYAFAFERYM
ncbi:hypothetical protein EVAR_41193_1 [Eumeta japonica]|uniref:Uncharacterized protein n=1 Tax=Eumeta variegata TaxID=151549 RepID=A0A4C1WPD6_EUMVA|nr:hypothetical protein EVAR_41193_1 [Eumeta japonica]